MRLAVILLLVLWAQDKPLKNAPDRFYACLHWSHPEKEWVCTLLNQDSYDHFKKAHPENYICNPRHQRCECGN